MTPVGFHAVPDLKGMNVLELTEAIQGDMVTGIRRARPATRWSGLIAFSMVALMMSAASLPGAIAADATIAATAQSAIPQEKLDSLLAPIALYPDELLGQTLIASTYPLDVVAAARFVTENRDLKGDALDAAVAAKNWDPSVQSLTAFPQVLEMMNDKLDWTQELGDAFLADEQRVMQTVQSLRHKADQAGNLKSGEQQKVIKEKTIIIIEPARTDVVYVPTYNPTIIYGTWWAPHYPPYYYPPPPYYYPPGSLFVAGMIGFGVAHAIHHNHWGWATPHWSGHGGNININVNRNNVFINNNPRFRENVRNGNWQHNPSQRKGVAYGDARTREQFRKVDANAVSARRDARGFEPAQTRDRNRPQAGRDTGTRDMQRPAPDRERPQAGRDTGTRDTQRPAPDRARPQPAQGAGMRDAGSRRPSDARPSFDAGQSRQQVQRNSDRGASSRASMRSSGGQSSGTRRR